jgi:hypothetical protein
MIPTGKFHPLLGHELMQLEEHDIDWSKKWKDMNDNDIANFLNYMQIAFVLKGGLDGIKALYISESAKNGYHE